MAVIGFWVLLALLAGLLLWAFNTAGASIGLSVLLTLVFMTGTVIISAEIIGGF